MTLYNELYELWKKEKENENEIQRLPKDFQTRIASYIKKMKAETRMLDKKTTKAKLLDNELKHAKAMINELFGVRYKKLRKKAFTNEPVARDALSEEEKKLYDCVLPLFESHHAFSKDILRGRLSPLQKDVKQVTCVLRFLQEIPALVGADMKTYGPFMPEDIATLPPENARILIKQGMAIEVETN